MVFLKKIVQIIGLCSFILFSFFYTDKVMHVIREEDSILIELNEIKGSEEISSVDAKINHDTIIPGINGRAINIEKSYKAMKKIGVFQRQNIIYDEIRPDISIINNKDKYVVMGNPIKQMVSFIFILNNNKYFERIKAIVNRKNIVVNFLVDYDYLISNSTKIKELKTCEFYNFGNHGIYSPDNILFSNNLISRISSNNANICMVTKKDKSILDLCSHNDLYTVYPNIIIYDQPYDMLKKQLTSGSIILFYTEKDITDELNVIIDYVHGKGLKIVGLQELLSEKFIDR